MSPIPLLMAFFQTPVAPTYPVYEEDKISVATYRARREAIKRQMPKDAVAFVFTNPPRNRSNDTDFRYRPDSNFRYLTGFEEPDAALLLAPSGIQVGGKTVTELLFVNVSNPMSETWLGYRMGPEHAVRLLGVEAALPNSQFRPTVETLGARPRVSVVPPDPSGVVGQMVKDFESWRTGSRSTINLTRELARMRVLKNSEELRLLRRAVNATVVAHAEAIRSAEPKMREYQLQAIVEYVFTRQGCEFTGYNSIVGSGPNSCILHYETNRREMKSGDLIVMDVGGEYHGYTADVTRTFPVNGKFTLPQRAIYDLVLRAQDAGIAACRSGAAFNAGHRAAMDVIQKGLVDLGVIASPDEASRYFMHGTSHYIGLDVHDAHGDNTLKPNYTLTVEPGIYIKEGSPCDPKWWNIGVRIEDDILVTEGDPINLSGALPRQATQIEALMRERGIGNAPLGKPGPKGKSAALR